VSPFAGISFANAIFNNCGLSRLIDNELGIRASTVGFLYSDIIRNFANIIFSGGNCAELFEQILQIDNWQTVEINYKLYQVASIKFDRFFPDENYRLVIMREKNDDKQLDLFTSDNFIYRTILTNDWDSDEKQVVEYYNQRGKSEKLFDVMNNDFCWKHLPCSFINENTSFLIITALIKNFYNYLVEKISKAFCDIKPTTRLKRFIFRFISVAGKWVYTARQWVLKLYSDRPYECLQI